MTRTGCGASPRSDTAVHWLSERLGDNAEEGAASGPSPKKLKLQDHASDERDDASEEQPGMGLSEVIDLVDLVRVPGHERDFAVHLTVAAKPFESDERKPKPSKKSPMTWSRC